MMKKIFTTFFICGFLFFGQTTNQLSALDFSSSVTDFFYDYVDPNEGTTSFRSLLIPFGGKAESLGWIFGFFVCLRAKKDVERTMRCKKFGYVGFFS